ncbi:MAG: DUF4340 domain-containing protein [Verrucomicrobiota bacterium]
MNRNQLILLLVLVLVVGGLGLAVYKKNDATWQAGANSSAGGKVLGDFALNDVARVVIKTGDSELALAKKNDTWVVAQRGDYPADFSQVGNLIQDLWQLKTVQEVKIGPSQLSKLELVTPAKGAADTGTLVELQGADSKPVATLLLGKRFMKKMDQYPGEGGFAAGRYVMPVNGSNRVSLVSETLNQADPKPEQWLDKSFFRIDRIASVAINSGTNQWKLSRENDSATDWKLADAKADEKVDSAKVPSFTSTLGSPAFNDVRPGVIDPQKPEPLDGSLTVQTFDGFTYLLKLGKAEGDNLPLAVTVTADLPKERVAGKDEKPEDKKKLDDEFAAKNKALAEKLAKEKAFETRVYLVSKSGFDPLLKSRADLLVEKKPEPTPSPSPSPAPTPVASTPISVTTPPVSAPVVVPEKAPAKAPKKK